MEISIIIQYIIALIISVLRPVLFKQYKEYITITLVLSILSMLLYSLSSFGYKYQTGVIDKEKLTKKLKGGVTPKNIFISFLSQLRFTLKFICISVLPLSISIPIAKLDIVFTELFNYYINEVPITFNLILSTGALLIGLFILNYNKIMNTSSTDKYNPLYLMGLIFSTIFVGFLNVYYSNYDKENEEDDVVYTESAGALVVALIVCYYYVSTKKEKIPDIKTIGTIFILCLLVFNTSIYIKWKLLKTEPLIRNQLIMNMTIPITFIVGILYYKEKFDTMKFIGIIIILFSITYYSYTSKNKEDVDHIVEKKEKIN